MTNIRVEKANVYAVALNDEAVAVQKANVYVLELPAQSVNVEKANVYVVEMLDLADRISVNVVGTWTKITPFVKADGVWVNPLAVYNNVAGSWRLSYYDITQL